MNPNKANLLSALALGAFGIYVIVVAARLPYVSDVGPGPGFFPMWLGIGLVFFSAALLASAKQERSHSPFSRSAGRALSGWLALITAIALLSRIGFLLSFLALTMFLIIALDRRPALLALGVAAGLAIAFQLIFVAALDVPLPKGPWGF